MVQKQDKAVAPILGGKGGQNVDTPHNSTHTDVFYISGREYFFVSPSAAQASAPGERIRTTSIRSAIKRGLS